MANLLGQAASSNSPFPTSARHVAMCARCGRGVLVEEYYPSALCICHECQDAPGVPARPVVTISEASKPPVRKFRLIK